jgi:hypothetical protein
MRLPGKPKGFDGSEVAGNLKRDRQRNACKQNDRHRALA